MNITFKLPLIVVKDIERSKMFYTRVLGQEIEFDFGENVAFKGGFAIHLADHFSKVVLQREGWIDEGSIGGEGMEMYFETEEVKKVAESVEKEGVELVHPLIEMPWAQRVIRFRDPDRHIIEIGEPMEVVVERLLCQGFKPEEVQKKTGLPMEMIMQTSTSERVIN